jgi:hypothetical protein
MRPTRAAGVPRGMVSAPLTVTANRTASLARDSAERGGIPRVLRLEALVMNGDVFTRRWLGLFALFAGLLAISPYFVHVVLGNSGCGEVSGRCQDMEAVLTLYGKRVVLAVVAIPLLVAVAGRALTVGAFAWAVPFALLMLVGAAPLMLDDTGLTVATMWPDILTVPALTPLLFLILLLVALSAYPDDQDGGTANLWRGVLAVVSIVTLFVIAPDWVGGVARLPWIGHFAETLALYLAAAHAALRIDAHLAQLANYCMIAFVLCAASMVISGRSAARSTGGGRTVRV